MKKISLLVIGGVILMGLYVIRQSVTSDGQLSENESKPAVAAAEKKRSGRAVNRSAVEASISETAMLSEEHKPNVIPEQPIVTTTHSADDFKWGQFSNTALDETVRLSSGPTSDAGVVGDSLLSGSYISSAQLKHRAFDTITMDYKAEVPAGSILKFEIQTRTSNDHWSEWQEIEPQDLRKPIPTIDATAGWRYRFTFFASSVETSPQVHSVSITTQNSTLLAKGPNAALQ